ncbi:Hypothetical predicted protein [Prunus dulcis]|uniref:Uncharacterized protein n=1 Tax=Prunus dulcis TaxID=3755 RepID=A0A5E4F2F3_PRUDU|nr:Hypothetical predicted protein [Prunus dulcis]
MALSAPLDVQCQETSRCQRNSKLFGSLGFYSGVAKRGLQTSSPITMQIPTSKLTTLSTPSYILTNHSPEPPSSLFASSQREGGARQVYTLHPTMIFHITCMET